MVNLVDICEILICYEPHTYLIIKYLNKTTQNIAERYDHRSAYLLNITACKGIKIFIKDTGAWLKYLFRIRDVMHWPDINICTFVAPYSLWEESDLIKIVFTIKDIPKNFEIEVEGLQILET